MAFREMRRRRQALSEQECIDILEGATTGILGVVGDEGYPYVVPLNFLYRDGKIIFHGASRGHKYDALLKNDKVSFCVIARDEIVPKDVTDYFRSVMIFGRAHLIEDEEKRYDAAYSLGMKYSSEPDVLDDIKRNYAQVAMFQIDIEQLTGKEAIELTRMRENPEQAEQA